MSALDDFDTLPLDRYDKDNSDELKKQTIDALSENFREVIKQKDPEKDVQNIINDFSIREINSLLFEEKAIGQKCYYDTIDGFLSAPDEYGDNVQSIIDGYLSIISDLQGIVQGKIWSGNLEGEEKNTAEFLNSRFIAISERTKLVLYVYKTWKPAEIKTQQITDATDELSKKLDKIEISTDKIMPNIVTLMGVFSSVIVVILTLLTTSSTWLSTANRSSILIAFVVPTGIAVLAVCALTALINVIINNTRVVKKDDKTEEKSEVKETNGLPDGIKTIINDFLSKWAAWLCISVMTILIVIVTIMIADRSEKNGKHYIIKYEVNPTQNEEIVSYGNDIAGETLGVTDIDNTKPEMYVYQEIILPNGETYMHKLTFEDENIREDGCVYYCILHGCFE